MNLFGKYIIFLTAIPPFIPSLTRIRSSGKIFLVALFLLLSRQISEITLQCVPFHPVPSALLTHSFQGVRARYRGRESVSATLENLVKAEAREGGNHGTACLVRLTRYA
jgi:hypothetical protein